MYGISDGLSQDGHVFCSYCSRVHANGTYMYNVTAIDFVASAKAWGRVTGFVDTVMVRCFMTYVWNKEQHCYTYSTHGIGKVLHEKKK